jgi:hypothetical protein
VKRIGRSGEKRLAANRRAAGEPVTASDFDRMTLAALDFDARP